MKMVIFLAALMLVVAGCRTTSSPEPMVKPPVSPRQAEPPLAIANKVVLGLLTNSPVGLGASGQPTVFLVPPPDPASVRLQEIVAILRAKLARERSFRLIATPSPKTYLLSATAANRNEAVFALTDAAGREVWQLVQRLE